MQSKLNCICKIKPLKKNGYLGYNNDVIDVSKQLVPGIYFGVQHDGKYIIWTHYELNSRYYPKYCPMCGRQLTNVEQ